VLVVDVVACSLRVVGRAFFSSLPLQQSINVGPFLETRVQGVVSGR
jgi:hypothetical protein